jgi:hypothetical protein
VWGEQKREKELLSFGGRYQEESNLFFLLVLSVVHVLANAI